MCTMLITISHYRAQKGSLNYQSPNNVYIPTDDEAAPAEKYLIKIPKSIKATHIRLCRPLNWAHWDLKASADLRAQFIFSYWIK